MNRKLYLLLPIFALLTGCTIFANNEDNSSTSKDENASKDDTKPDVDGLTPAVEETDPENILLYDTFYNPSSDVKLKITISNDSFAQVMHNGAEYHKELHDIYSPCDVEVEINGEKRTFQEVGIRLKGNTSREESQWSYDNGHFNGHAHFKLAFNETFEDNPDYTPTTAEKTLKKRRFGKAKKFNLKWNRNRDEGFVKESYASYILEQEGLLAQKCNNIDVTFVTDSETVNYTYSVQEDINSEFLEERLDVESNAGDLYKGGWADRGDGTWVGLYLNDNRDSLFGVEDCTQNKFYAYDLKTNKKKSDMSNIKNLIAAFKANDSGASQDTLRNKLREYVDVDYLLRFMAMEWVIGNPDSLRYHYNNTYFYFSSKNGLMYPIMYDNDRCFGITNGWDVLPFVSPTSPKDSMNNFDSDQISPLYWRTILSGNNKYPVVNDYRAKYLEYVNEYATKYLNEETFNAYKESFHLLDDDVYGGNVSFSEYSRVMKSLIGA